MVILYKKWYKKEGLVCEKELRNVQNKEHFNWIDILKGLGIILVIMGHQRLSPELLNYIYLFHMPLFFFISGYLMNISKYNSIGHLIKKKSKTLLIPYITFSIISIICYSVIGQVDLDASATLQSFIEGKRNEIFYNVPLWFLIGLFVIEIMYYVLKKVIKNNGLLLLVIMIINFISVVILKVIEAPTWIWSIDTAMYYLLYYQLGNLYRIYSIKLADLKVVGKVAASLFVFICISLNLILLLSPDLIYFVYQYVNTERMFLFIWLIVCGTAGITTFVCLSKFIRNSKRLEYIGKNSLIIFTLHYPIGIWGLDMLKVQLQIDIIHSNILSLIELTIILLVLLPIVKIINTNFPILLGKGHFNLNRK